MNHESIFRKQSLERISSPEKTDDYLRIVKPGKGLLAGAAVLLIAAGILWLLTMSVAGSFHA